jgi:hypothetical protein
MGKKLAYLCGYGAPYIPNLKFKKPEFKLGDFREVNVLALPLPQLLPLTVANSYS